MVGKQTIVRILMMVIIFSTISITTVSATEITVGKNTSYDHTSILEAVAEASDGDTIIVYAATYKENIDIDKSLIIRTDSASTEACIQAADVNEPVLHITADNVRISGFEIINSSEECGIDIESVDGCTITGTTLRSNWNGIFVEDSNNTSIIGNYIFENECSGIYLLNDTNCTIEDNDLQGNYQGIEMLYSDYNIITDNTIGNNTKNGLDLFDSNNNKIKNNDETENECGIYIMMSNENNIEKNTVLKNKKGIDLSNSRFNTFSGNEIDYNQKNIIFTESNHNLIYNNIINSTGIELIGEMSNNWNISVTNGENIVGGFLLGGNYWTDSQNEGISQTCTDENHDGFCDCTYDLGENYNYDNSFNIDYLPLRKTDFITVDDDDDNNADYNSIQDAVNNASDKDTIVVFPGTYSENIDVNKELRIVSASGDPDDTIVQALNPDGHVFHVTADNVTVSGFNVSVATGSGKAGIYLDNVENNNISYNVLSNNSIGIYLVSCSNNTLADNTATNNDYGIHLSSSGNNMLTNNTAEYNDIYGIHLVSSGNNTLNGNTAEHNNNYGIHLVYSSNNMLTGNNAVDNDGHGIYLQSSSNNTLTGNNVADNNYGIWMIYSSKNTLNYNNIAHNDLGIRISASVNNIICVNDFLNNNDTDYTYNYLEEVGYLYNDSLYIGYIGNYYSNYKAADKNNDGVNDTAPYALIDLSENYQLTSNPIQSITIEGEHINPTSLTTTDSKTFPIKIGESYKITISTIKSTEIDNISLKVYDSNGTKLTTSFEVNRSDNDYILNFSVNETEQEVGSSGDIEIILQNINVSGTVVEEYKKIAPIIFTFFEFKENDDGLYEIFPDKNGTGSTVVIASPEFEQEFVTEYWTDEGLSSVEIDKKLFNLACLQTVALNEIVKKWPDSTIQIYDKDVAQATVERDIDNFRSNKKQVVIVGALPHAETSFGNLKASKAYPASYLSYTMAAEINNQNLWHENDIVYVAKHYRAMQYFNALNPIVINLMEIPHIYRLIKYDTSSEFGSDDTDYPAILIAKENHPLLQVSPTLGTDIRGDISEIDYSKTLYKMGTLMPLGYTYYPGLDIEREYEICTLTVHIGLDKFNAEASFPENFYFKAGISRNEEEVKNEIYCGRNGKYSWTSFKYYLLKQTITINENLGYQKISGVEDKALKRVNSIPLIPNSCKMLIKEMVTGYFDALTLICAPHALISENEVLQYVLEPSSAHTLLSDTLNKLSTEDKTVSEIVIYQNEKYPGKVALINGAISVISEVFSEIDLASSDKSPYSVTPTLEAESHVYDYVGASDNINYILLMDDIVTESTIFESKVENGAFDYKDALDLIGKGLGLYEKDSGTTDKKYKELSKKRDKAARLARLACKAGSAISSYEEAQEAATFNANQLFYIGDPYLTGYDDPVSNITVDPLPDTIKIDFSSKPNSADFMGTTFIFPNVTSFEMTNVTSKVILEDWLPSSGLPKTQVMTISIFHPSNQVIDGINYSLSNETVMENITLPVGAVTIENSTVPGLMDNLTGYPSYRMMMGTEDLGNISHTVLRIFPTIYYPNKTLVYYEDIDVTLNVKNVTLPDIDVHLDSYPNIIGVRSGNTSSAILRFYNDLYSTDNATVKVVFNSSSDMTIDGINASLPLSLELGTSSDDYYREIPVNITIPEVSTKETFYMNVTLEYFDGNDTTSKLYSIPVIAIPENMTDLEIIDVDFPEELEAYHTYNVSVSIKNSGQNTVAFVPVKLFLDYNETSETTLNEIKVNETCVEYFSFMPTTTGEHNLTVVVSPSPYELNLENNYYTELFDIKTVITVDSSGGGDYTSINEALEASIDGCTIVVYPGEYNENIYVDKSVTILSASIDPTNTVVKAAEPMNPVFHLVKNDVTITGFGITNSNNAGIYLDNVQECTISCNNIESNGNGIILNNSIDNNLAENRIADNSDIGLQISGSNGNIIDSNIFTDNRYGLDLTYSDKNKVNDCIVYNNEKGILIENSNENHLTNSVLYENEEGVYFTLSSNNTMHNNAITDNSQEGIVLHNSGSNLIYNNFFNNIENIEINGDNFWNTTMVKGENIIGGPYLGGNFWATPNNTGFSQISKDENGDGICDIEYQITENNTDYFPLTYIKDETIQDNNEDESINIIFEYSEEPESNIEMTMLSKQYVSEGKHLIYDFSDENDCLISVEFDSKKTVGYVITTVDILKGRSFLVSSSPDGETYLNMNICVGNDNFSTSEFIDNVIIKFKVDKSWIADNSINETTIRLNLYNNGKWTQLNSIKADEDGSYLFFEANTPTFSSFAITGEEIVYSPIDDNEILEKSTEEAKQDSQDISGFGVIGAAAIILIIISVLKRRKTN
ncbi:NosD domain-containing protein [Methanolobus sediminis]|uniref:NosD domain-containing protein n=1 Tax=Methanolobus sediminis TaxID=3072978 RepID=A0AA51YLK8_9EURY|nr:NosD domain-containing protein [Methanolobus sediminis]WMW25032.1 NosD domain-containing protein [Methanolobus sediminis]